MEESKKPENQPGSQGEQAVSVLKNPNRINYKLYWRFSRGDYELCGSMLNKWKLQSCKNYEFGHYLQALLYRKKGNLNESLKFMKLCHLIDATNPIFLKELAKTFCILGKHKTALNTIAAVPEVQRDWELLEIAGDIFTLLKDSTRAKESYLKALEQNNSKSILLKLAKIYMSENQLDQSQILFNEYTDKNNQDPEILEELGFMYLSLNNRPEALHYLGQSLVQNPQNQDILISLGAISQEYGEVDGAMQRYKEFFEENQNSPEMWSNVGNCYLERDMHVSALSCFKRALYLNPLEWSIYYNLGLVYLSMKIYSTAFHYFISSVKFNPQNAEAYMMVGICLNKLEDPANAYTAFDKATQLDSSNHVIFLNFAIFLAEHLKDAANLDLAREKFSQHDELYRRRGSKREAHIEAQRSELRVVLSIDNKSVSL